VRCSSTSVRDDDRRRSSARAASRGRRHVRARWPGVHKSLADRLDLPFPRAPRRSRSTTPRACVDQADDVATIVADDVRVWAAGVELVMEELSAATCCRAGSSCAAAGSRCRRSAPALASQAFYERLPFARPPEVIVMAPDQIETISDATDLLVDQQDVTPLGSAYQAIELQTSEDAPRRRARACYAR
jgi:hypothetical protein